LAVVLIDDERQAGQVDGRFSGTLDVERLDRSSAELMELREPSRDAL
jgi:hypothetical protein